MAKVINPKQSGKLSECEGEFVFTLTHPRNGCPHDQDTRAVSVWAQKRTAAQNLVAASADTCEDCAAKYLLTRLRSP